MQELTLVIPTITSNPRRKQESTRGVTPIALKTGMRILWGEGVVLPCGGVVEWVVSGRVGTKVCDPVLPTWDFSIKPT